MNFCSECGRMKPTETGVPIENLGEWEDVKPVDRTLRSWKCVCGKDNLYSEDPDTEDQIERM